VKIEALAQLGDMLESMEKNTGAKGIGKSAVTKVNHTPPTLKELGIDKKTSMVVQQLAAMPKEIRQAIAEQKTTFQKEVLAANREINTKRIVKETSALPKRVYQVGQPVYVRQA